MQKRDCCGGKLIVSKNCCRPKGDGGGGGEFVPFRVDPVIEAG